MKNRPRKRGTTPEESLYRTIEAHMPPLGYDRIRPSVETVAPADDISSVPVSTRRRWAPVLTAVAATLAVVCGISVSGLWIADRIRRPASDFPPLSETGDSGMTESLPDASTEEATSGIAPETEPSAGETALPELPPETVPPLESSPVTTPLPETAPEPESTPVPDTVSAQILAAAPAEVMINGVTYQKTKTCLTTPMIGAEIESKQGPEEHQISVTCHYVIGESVGESVAICYENTYILYIVTHVDGRETEA